MALLQRTFASNSIWIGTGDSSSAWGGYSSGQYPFAIYDGASPLLYFTTQSAINQLSFSINSQLGSVGFSSGMMGSGFRIENTSSTGGQWWSATFDDLWIRGALHAWQFIVNQIRATNGSLWVSDAGKAISMSYGANTDEIVLYFDTGSMLPFVDNDIIRSRRWLISGADTDSGVLPEQWDIIFELSDVDYANSLATASISNPTDYWISSNISFPDFFETASTLTTDWVRVGNSSDDARKGAIYLTSNDLDGPFIDVYDHMDSVADAHGGTSQSVTHSILEARLGKLEGLTTQTFGQLQGYGLYSENVYLKGTVSATAGTFSAWLASPTGYIGGWTISSNTLYSGDVTLSAKQDHEYIGFSASALTQSGIYIGQSSSVSPGTYGISMFSQYGWEGSYFLWNGSNLFIQSPGFTLSADGLTIEGELEATDGYIGGWSVSNYALSSNQVTISSALTNSYFGVTADHYNEDGIYLGYSDSKNLFSVTDEDSGIFWDGTQLGITSSNFTLSQGNIIAKGGTIAGWDINSNEIYKTTAFNTIILKTSTSSQWNWVDYQGYPFDLDGEKFLDVLHNYYTASENKTYWTEESGTSSVSLGDNEEAIVLFTSSYNKQGLIVDVDGGIAAFDIEPNETIYFGIDHIDIHNYAEWNASPYADSLALILADDSDNNLTDVVILSAGAQDYSIVSRDNLFFSYTNRTGDVVSTKLKLYSKNNRTAVSVDDEEEEQLYYILGITASGMGIARAKGYTELNPSGLLVYGGPTNYIKITNETSGSITQSYGVIAIDTLYVRGVQINGGFSGSSGGGGVDGVGTANTLAMWQDPNTIQNSIITQQNSATISVDGTVSAPVYSGSGFYPSSSANGSTAIGNLPADADLTGLSIKNILDTMMNYAAPTFGNFYFTSGSTDLGYSSQVVQVGFPIGHPCSWTCSITNIGNVKDGSHIILTNDIGWDTSNEISAATPIQTASTSDHTVYYQNTAGSGYFRLTGTSKLNTSFIKTFNFYWRHPVLVFHSDSSSLDQSAFDDICDSIPGVSPYKYAKDLTHGSNVADGNTFTFSSSGISANRYVWVAYPSSWAYVPNKFEMQPDGGAGSWVDYAIDTNNTNLNYSNVYNGDTITYRLIRTDLKTGETDAPSVKIST